MNTRLPVSSTRFVSTRHRTAHTEGGRRKATSHVDVLELKLLERGHCAKGIASDVRPRSSSIPILSYIQGTRIGVIVRTNSGVLVCMYLSLSGTNYTG
eukprot:3445851-Rhodomonas_salina.1